MSSQAVNCPEQFLFYSIRDSLKSKPGVLKNAISNIGRGVLINVLLVNVCSFKIVNVSISPLISLTS